MAQLTAKNQNSQDGEKCEQLDFSLFGLWMMRKALETERDPKVVDLKVAQTWMQYCGPVMEELSADRRSFDGRLGIGGEKHKEKGWTGFSEDRWRIWNEALGSLS